MYCEGRRAIVLEPLCCISQTVLRRGRGIPPSSPLVPPSSVARNTRLAPTGLSLFPLTPGICAPTKATTATGARLLGRSGRRHPAAPPGIVRFSSNPSLNYVLLLTTCHTTRRPTRCCPACHPTRRLSAPGRLRSAVATLMCPLMGPMLGPALCASPPRFPGRCPPCHRSSDQRVPPCEEKRDCRRM